MADVDLAVRVTQSGAEAAIANLENLQKRGLSTGAALDRVATSATAMGTAIERATAKAGSGSSLSGVDKAANSATSALSALETEYRRLAQAQTNQTAAQRLANNLGSNPAKALNQIATLRAAYNADPIRDAMVVEQQEQEVLAARNGKLAATAALNESVWGSYAANLSAADLAVDRLTQAELRYAEAQRATASAVAAGTGNRVAAGLPGAGSFRTISASEQQAINSAIQQEAVALARVTTARNELAAAESREATAAYRARSVQQDDSQFGYFKYLIIAGFANRAADAIASIGEAAIKASADQQRSFADVDRTFDGTQRQLTDLRQTLTELSTATPFSFVDLSQIAALGNQLGIAATDIQGFTTTIANYSLVSGESADQAATEFAKIGNLTALPASQFNNLGSSIEYVARTTAATESTISATAKEISALASGAGFSAQSIVGLSGALSSLSIPPERARGALSLYFGALNGAIASGGPKLEAFATITGIAKDQLAQLVANNQGQQVFTAFLNGLSDLNSVAKTTALKEVGLSTIRVDQTMRALSQNVPLVTSSLQGANTAFEANTELARQAAIVQETLAVKYQEFQSAVQNVAAAAGDVFGPALGLALEAVTDLLVGIERFTRTPLGQVMAGIAGAVGLVVVALLSLLGAFALATAGMKVIPWALTSLGANEANSSIVQFIGGLFGLNIAVAETEAGLAVTSSRFQKLSTDVVATKVELLGLPGVMTAVAAGDAELTVGNIAVGDSSVAAAAGLRTMKIALASTGIGLAIVLVGTLVTYLMDAGNAAKSAAQQNKDFFGGAYPSTIADGLKKDQAEYARTGTAIQQIKTNVRESTTATEPWVSALQSATGAQVALGDGTNKTTEKIKDQTVAYGSNAKAALATALSNSKSFQSLFKDTKANAALAAQGFDVNAFTKALLGDPVRGGQQYLTLFSQGIASKYGLTVNELKRTFDALDGVTSKFSTTGTAGKGLAAFNEGLQLSGGKTLGADQLNALNALRPAYETVTSAADATAAAIKKEGAQAAISAAANKAVQSATVGLGDGFVGATSSLTDYQDAVQSGFQSTLGFANVLNALTSAGAKIGDIRIGGFTKGLEDSNNAAVTFFNGLQKMAAGGKTSFAQQLASIGPSAQGILSSALNATPETQAKLEQDARFAAFLSSDAFKTAFSANMQTDFDAYAQIFKATGNLDAVKGYIAAQVAGTGAEFEKQWDIQHPTFPLNVELQDPSQNDIDFWKQQNDGKLTVTAKVIPLGGFGGTPATENVNQYTDTATGNTITLPARLDGKALTDSLAYWEAHENATPEEIAAALNTGRFSSDINAWVQSHGPISVQASVMVTQSSLDRMNARIRAALGPQASTVQAHGGLQDWANWDAHPARFAGGGQFQGAGTGTSDSLWARVSRGEYINTSDTVNYWGGADFFDSLSRRMLPASFAGMLGAAAGAGNRGPQNVMNVHLEQHNPVTRDPLAQLREDSENLAAGIWGSGVLGS